MGPCYRCGRKLIEPVKGGIKLYFLCNKENEEPEGIFLSHDRKKRYSVKGCSMFFEVQAPADPSPEIVKRLGCGAAPGQSSIEGFF